MFAEERHAAIEQYLKEEGKVRVRELSEKFQVTEDCIRKDLKLLENAGRCKRTYGGAILSQDYPQARYLADRRDYHIKNKATIAGKALELIREGETVFIDISTTNIELAKVLAHSRKKITVVSNMIDILQILAGNPDITVIGTGGILHRNVNGFMGSAAIETIRQYSYDRSFMGCCGMDPTDRTFTTLGVEDGLTKKSAVACSRHTYIMMERSKFYFNESYKFAQLDDVDAIITDEYPDATICQMLETVGVELI
ncbi:MAG: DeoR/GlpR family DNA-binding transcription regulator [Lachnospiraceae bacterium]|nr:DeoR/GlpR family DNA-binding transcription regulator [Lachnospiraceae bacterium]